MKEGRGHPCRGGRSPDLTGCKSEAGATLCSRWWFPSPASGLPPGFLFHPKSLRQRLGPGMVWLFSPMEPSISPFSLCSIRAKGHPEMGVVAFLVPDFKIFWVLRVPQPSGGTCGQGGSTVCHRGLPQAQQKEADADPLLTSPRAALMVPQGSGFALWSQENVFPTPCSSKAFATVKSSRKKQHQTLVPKNLHTHHLSVFRVSPTILESLVSGGMCLSEWGILGFLVQSAHG